MGLCRTTGYQTSIQRFTKHAHKIRDRVTQTPLNTGNELRFAGMVSSSCSTSNTRRVNLVTNPVITHECGKEHAQFKLLGVNYDLFKEELYVDNMEETLNTPANFLENCTLIQLLEK